MQFMSITYYIIPLLLNILCIIVFLLFRREMQSLIKVILLNYIGANCLLILIIYSLYIRKYYFIDIVLLYAIVAVVANVAISDYIMKRDNKGDI